MENRVFKIGDRVKFSCRGEFTPHEFIILDMGFHSTLKCLVYNVKRLSDGKTGQITMTSNWQIHHIINGLERAKEIIINER
jgi:hypothetical protein